MPEQGLDYRRLALELAGLIQQNGGGNLGYGYKAVSSTPSTIYGHGPGGLFSAPGLDPRVFNAMVLPHLGLQAMLPMRSTTTTNPLFAIMTGVTATSGSQPSGACDDPKTAGLMKLCLQSFPLGRFGLQTDVVNLEHFGEITNRGEFRDLQLLGNPVSDGTGAPTVSSNAQRALQTEVGKKLFEFAASWAREYAPVAYDGSPVNNNGEGYKEYYGLDSIINTGHRDAETGVACPAADSIIRSFNNDNVINNGSNLVNTIQNIFRQLRFNAQRMGLNPVEWVITMPFGMFYQLTEVWSYYYFTQALNGLTLPTSVTVNVGGEQAAGLRDQMRGNLYSRTGQFLMIDGQRVPVVLDDAIAETEIAAGVFTSSIYFIPLTVLGGTEVAFMEYFDYDTPGGAMDGARLMAPGDSYYTTDRGAFFWHRKPPTNLCVQLAAWHRPRLILLTPQIAARLTNVAWTPNTHERSPFTDSAYFVDGGKTSRSANAPNYYSPTA